MLSLPTSGSCCVLCSQRVSGDSNPSSASLACLDRKLLDARMLVNARHFSQHGPELTRLSDALLYNN